jgi:hypothetical protein
MSEPFCRSCGAYHDLRTPGCDACKHRALYLEWSITRTEWHLEKLARKAAYKRRRRAGIV